MTIRHRPLCEVRFATGLEFDDAVTHHDLRRDGPAPTKEVPAAVMAER